MAITVTDCFVHGSMIRTQSAKSSSGPSWRPVRAFTTVAPSPAGGLAASLLKKLGNVFFTHPGFLILIPGTFNPRIAKHIAILWSLYVSISAPCRFEWNTSSVSPVSTTLAPHRLNSVRKAATRSHSCSRNRPKSVKLTGPDAGSTAAIGAITIAVMMLSPRSRLRENSRGETALSVLFAPTAFDVANPATSTNLQSILGKLSSICQPDRGQLATVILVG